MNNWISVKARIPEDMGDVLVSCKSYRNGKWEHRVNVGYHTDHFGWIVNNACDGNQVTHWMPLPDPPEEIEAT